MPVKSVSDKRNRGMPVVQACQRIALSHLTHKILRSLVLIYVKGEEIRDDITVFLHYLVDGVRPSGCHFYVHDSVEFNFIKSYATVISQYEPVLTEKVGDISLFILNDRVFNNFIDHLLVGFLLVISPVEDLALARQMEPHELILGQICNYEK